MHGIDECFAHSQVIELKQPHDRPAQADANNKAKQASHLTLAANRLSPRLQWRSCPPNAALLEVVQFHVGIFHSQFCRSTTPNHWSMAHD